MQHSTKIPTSAPLICNVCPSAKISIFADSEIIRLFLYQVMTGGGIALASHFNITGVPTLTLNTVTEVPLWSLMLGGTVEEEQSDFCLSSVKTKKKLPKKNPKYCTLS